MFMGRDPSPITRSIVMGWLVESDRVVGVDDEVRCINVVAFQDHLEHFWLMDCTFFHELNDLILLADVLIDVVIQLHLGLVLQLTSLGQEIFFLNWVSKVLAIFSHEVELTDVCPIVISISHWVHCPNSYVFSSSKKEHSMNFSIDTLPV